MVKKYKLKQNGSERQPGTKTAADALLQQRLAKEKQQAVLRQQYESQPTIGTAPTATPYGEAVRNYKNSQYAYQTGTPIDEQGTVHPEFIPNKDKNVKRVDDLLNTVGNAAMIAEGAEVAGSAIRKGVGKLLEKAATKRWKPPTDLSALEYRSPNDGRLAYKVDPEDYQNFNTRESYQTALQDVEDAKTNFNKTDPGMIRQRKFQGLMDKSKERDLTAGRDLVRRSNRYEFNTNIPREEQSPLYKEDNNLFYEKRFRDLFPDKSKLPPGAGNMSNNELIDFFTQHVGNHPVTHKQLEDFLPRYQPNNPFTDWSDKRIKAATDQMVKDYQAHYTMSPGENPSAINRNLSNLGSSANRSQTSGSSISSQWLDTAPWKDVGMEMRGSMEMMELDPTREDDVNKFRKLFKQHTGERFLKDQKTPNFNEIFQHVPLNQYGGYSQNGSDEEDSYDFGNSVLQNYYQRQQESEQQQQQQEQEQAASYEEPPQQESSDESSSSGEPQQDMSIPDADYFAKAAFQYNGDNAQQEELNDLREQMAMMQSNQSALEGMLLGDFDQGGEDNSDGEDGGGYGYGTPDYHYDSPGGSSGGTAAVRYNNPGNIKYGDFAASFGATKGGPATDGGNFAYFPSTGAGLRAQKELLRSKGYANLNVTDAMKRWSNNGPYSEKIGQTFGNKLMKNMSDAEMDALIKMQIQGEDANMYKKLYHQSGGSVPVASSSTQKYHGLNNDDLQHLLIENNGYNSYRGLDSGKPVHLYDERGAYQTLFGPDDLATLYGNVYEHR